MTIDQNCQNIVIENKSFNFLFHFTKYNFFVGKNRQNMVMDFFKYFYVDKNCQYILNFLFHVVQNFVARWYYETLKQAYDKDIQK